MKAKDVKLKKGMTVTLLTGNTYTLQRITRHRIWLTRPGLPFPQEVSPELVKLCIAKASR